MFCNFERYRYWTEYLDEWMSKWMTSWLLYVQEFLSIWYIVLLYRNGYDFFDKESNIFVENSLLSEFVSGYFKTCFSRSFKHSSFATVCPRSLVHYYVLSILWKLDKTPWKYGTICKIDSEFYEISKPANVAFLSITWKYKISIIH